MKNNMPSSKEVFNEAEKELSRRKFQQRWDLYVQDFLDAGFTLKQAQKLAEEFSQFKSI